MCAIAAGKRGRRVLVLDHANKVGKKILMSGGGRCNFTNYFVGPENFLSGNPHFCKSALSRFSQWDFLALVEQHGVPYHERGHGQLFCNESAKDIVNMLLAECADANVDIRLNTKITGIARESRGFVVSTDTCRFESDSLVVACGGLSIPKIGASPLGYQIARQFGIPMVPTRAGLVPLTLQPADKDRFGQLSGIAVYSEANTARQAFRENLLFTHRGLSGPVILQISSYWRPGDVVTINLSPEFDILEHLMAQRQQKPKGTVRNCLERHLPRRLLAGFLPEEALGKSMADCPDQQLEAIAVQLQAWHVKPNGTEGYRTAEVTLGKMTSCFENFLQS